MLTPALPIHFFDSLYALEHVDESSPRPPPSPVFRAPSEPYPHFIIYNPFIMWNYYYYYGERMFNKVMASYNRSYRNLSVLKTSLQK